MQGHRGLSGLVLAAEKAADTSADGERRARQADVNTQYTALAKQLGELGYSKAADQATAWKISWDKLSAQVDSRSLPSADSFAAHAALVEQTIRLIDSVADASSLSLDPVAETYYVMTALVDHLPRLAESTAAVRGKGTALLASGKLSANDKPAMAADIRNTHYLSERANSQIGKAADISTDLRKTLASVSGANTAEVDRFFKLVDAQLLAAAKPGVAAAEFYKVAARQWTRNTA